MSDHSLSDIADAYASSGDASVELQEAAPVDLEKSAKQGSNEELLSPDKAPENPTLYSRAYALGAAVMMTVWLPVLFGAVFGGAMQRARVHEFSAIRKQMLFKNFIMLKMFLGAASVSVLTVAALRRWGSVGTRENVDRSAGLMTTKFDKGLLSLAAGAFILGTGLTVAGSCPGTVFAQVGAGSSQAWLVLAGGLVGAFSYGALEAFTPGWASFTSYGKPSAEQSTLPGLLSPLVSISPSAMSVIVGLCFAAVVVGTEAGIDWKDELEEIVPADEANWSDALPAGISGVALGALQLPMLMLLGNHLGCSASYVTVASHIAVFFKRSATFNALKTNYWQVFFAVGAALGSLTSAKISDASFQSDDIVTNFQAVLGGFLFEVGARLASGCTSGHGITGTAHLATLSFVAVGAMFAGGIATAFLFFPDT